MTLTPSKPSVWLVRKDYYFDRTEARRVVQFFCEHLKHIKGEHAGQPFYLEPWQYKIVRRLFGWKRRKDGSRKYRVFFFFVARKNGKTIFGGGAGLYLLDADKEAGAEIVCAAADTDQASIIFEMAKAMCAADTVLSQRTKAYRRSLVVHATGSSFKVLSSEAHTKHGSNLHGILVDEVHALPNRELVDVLRTSTGVRRQPLEVYCTTAGFDRHSICYELYDYACKVRDGIIDDPSFLPVIYEAPKDDDIHDPKTWKKANPNLGVSISYEYMEAAAKMAKDNPAYENTFRRLHLNQWTEQDVRSIPMHLWDECGKLPWDAEKLKGQPCWGGLDLASTTDLTALALVFNIEGDWHVLMRFWVPEDTIPLRKRDARVPYDQWRDEGFLIATPGAVCDYDRVRTEVNELYEVYNIQEIAIDRWNSTQISTQLDGDGLTVVPYGQGFASMTSPTKELLGAVKSKRLSHGNHPVLRWCASNLATEEDAAGNLKPSKKKSPEKIDGIVAIINGLGRAIVNEEFGRSVYDTKGIDFW